MGLNVSIHLAFRCRKVGEVGMSRLKPLVRERFKSKSNKYKCVSIHYSGENLYEVVGIQNKNHCEYIERISERLPLKLARKAMWVYAEVQDGLPVLEGR